MTITASNKILLCYVLYHQKWHLSETLISVISFVKELEGKRCVKCVQYSGLKVVLLHIFDKLEHLKQLFSHLTTHIICTEHCWQ